MFRRNFWGIHFLSYTDQREATLKEEWIVFYSWLLCRSRVQCLLQLAHKVRAILRDNVPYIDFYDIAF